MAFAGLLPALEAGNIDMIISNMTMTPGRNMKWPSWVPISPPARGCSPSAGALGDAMKMEDLDNINYTFVALKGSTSEAVTRKGAPLAKLMTVNTENEGVQMVIDGKADGMLADFPICVVAAYRHKGAGLVPVKAPSPTSPSGSRCPRGIPSCSTGCKNFMHSIEKAGYMKDLGEKWFAKPTWIDQLK